MCLDRLKKFRITSNIGIKFFIPDNHYHLHSSVLYGKKLPVGKWINEKDFRIEDDCGLPIKKLLTRHEVGNFYKTGFHVYYKYGVSNPRYRRLVKFRKIITTGIQDQREVIVAKEIFIIPKKDEHKYIKKGGFKCV